jgi:iron complex outermembrane receptor protein
LLDRRLRINAALFLADISDLALNATVNLGGGALSFPVQNAGDATIKGLEFEITHRPIDALTIYASGALSDGNYDSLAPGSAPFNSQLPANVVNGMNAGGLGVAKATPPQVPDYTIALGADYGVDLAFAGGSRFTIGADVFRTDDFVTSATNDFVVKAYSRFNAHLGLAVGDNWSFRIAAKNVNDKQTINVGSRGLGGYLVLPPREVLFSVTYTQ